MWMKQRIERPEDMAIRLVAESEQVSISTAGGILELLTGAVLVPPLAPFLIVGAVIAVPLDKLGKWLQRGDRAMPSEWFPHVEAMASKDGRFFVGRMLQESGQVTMSDAMRFVAIEKWAEKRSQDAELLVHSEDAKKALIDHYIANQSLFDKAMKGASVALGATISTGLNVIKAAKRKLDVGF